MPSIHPRTPQDLSPGMEHYLRTIYDLQQEKGYARVTDIAEGQDVAKSAVSYALRVLGSLGYVEHRAYESVLLTEEGVNRARGVSGKYSILHQFLTEVLGVDKETAFVDACLMEHYVSNGTVDRLVDLIRFFEEQEHHDVVGVFHAYRRSCESDDSCPSCSFHCDAIIPAVEAEEPALDTGTVTPKTPAMRRKRKGHLRETEKDG